MSRELIVTKDGSSSISVPEMRVAYHSLYGAISESKHVYIEAGLKHVLNNLPKKQLNIFEMGFGTGLNTLLTFLENRTEHRLIYYEAIDTHPLQPEEYTVLKYESLLGNEDQSIFQFLHTSAWNQEINISPSFILHKKKCSLLEYTTDSSFDLIYFDAFAPAAQPELWSLNVFLKMISICNDGAILVTYCSKGDVRRALIQAGFKVEKLKGPPGKREMLRGRKS